MKRTVLILCMAVLLCACGTTKNAGGALQSSDGTLLNSGGALQGADGTSLNLNESLQGADERSREPEFQDSFVLGGIRVSDSDGLNETKIGTELTNAAEELLREKYGEEFCCEQYLYREEYSLLVTLTAYPKAAPNLVFSLDVRGRDGLELWWDQYYNELHRREIEEYVYPAAAQFGIESNQFFMDVNDMVTTPEISEKTFFQKNIHIYLSVSEEKAQELHDEIERFAGAVYDKIRSEEVFWIFLCHEGMNSAKDFSYKKIWRSYRIGYSPYASADSEGACGRLDISYNGRDVSERECWSIPVFGGGQETEQPNGF